MADVIIARDEELVALRAFLSDDLDGPAALLLEGEAGIGKSILWEAALADVSGGPRTILRAQPSEAEIELSFAGLGDLLGDRVQEVLPALPSPQRRAIEVALLLEPSDGEGPDTRAVAAACLGALRAQAKAGPVVVAIDDVQWLDLSSGAALAFSLRRLSDEPIRLLFAQRTGPCTEPPLGLDRPPPGLALQRIGVGPLSLAALQRLLKARLGVTFSRPTLRRIQETSRGNPFFALELARALDRLDRPDPNAPLPVPDELGALLRQRLAQFPPQTAEALLLAALLANPSLERIERILDRSAVAALRPALDSYVVRLEEGRVRFDHPLLASVAIASADPHERRVLHRRVAGASDELEEKARHLALAAEGPDEAIAAALEKAAEAVARRGAQEAAARLADQAWRLTPAMSTHKRAERAAAAGWYAWLAGDAARARELLGDALAEGESGVARARVLDLYMRLELQAGNRHLVPDMCRTVLEEADGDPVLVAHAYELLAWNLLMSRDDMPSAARFAGLAVELAEATGDPVQLSDALAARAQAEFFLGEGLPSPSMERALAIEWEDLSERGLRSARLHWSLLLQCADRFDEARDELEAVRERALASGDASALPWISMRLSQLELYAGRWDVSLAHADEGHAEAVETRQDSQVAMLTCTRALVLAHLGLVDEAEALATEGLAAAARFGDGIGARVARWALGLVALVRGEVATAADLLGALRRESRDGHIVEPGENRYAGDLVAALVALDRTDEATDVGSELERCGRRLSRPAVLAVAARSRGLVAAAQGDWPAALADFDAAMSLHDAAPLPFERARTLLALGATQRRARRLRDARRSLDTARESFERLGAAPWKLQAEQELARIGGRPAADGRLTPSEEQVAELAARGLTNREVADELVVSQRTVETHLSNVYRKLGIRSRTELARRRGEGTESVAAAPKAT